jgi:hypothetical protein
LQVLARLAFALRNPEFREVIRRQGSAEEILQQARRLEDALQQSGGEIH